MDSLEAAGVAVETGFGITHVVCRNAAGKTKTVPFEELIRFISGGNEVYTAVGGRHTPVYVVHGPERRAYLRTKANESVEDNLLSLPRY